MIAKLSGRLDATGEDWAVVDVGGVGYLVHCSSRTLAALGEVGEGCTVHTQLQVSENDMRLLGFADSAERVVALDKNLEMLRVARAKLQHLPTAQIELVQGDFADLPFPDSSFDTVVLHQVLHFAADPAPALAEAARVLRSGGRIAIVDFASHDHEELRTRHQHVRLGFTDRQMAELLRGAGFSVSPPLALEGGPLVVKIWTAKRRSAPALKTPASLTETV